MLLPASQVVQDKVATNGQVATFDSTLGLYTPQTTIAMTTQTWGTVWAGPADGGTAAVPTFRNLTISDLPTIGKRNMKYYAGTTTGITVISLGLVATGAPTYTNADDATGQWRKFVSTAAAANDLAFTSVFQADWLADWTFRIKTDTTLPSDCQAFGLSDGATYGTATGEFNGASVVAVRYAPILGVGDTGSTWRVVHADGATAATVINTSMAIAVDTVYEFRFQWLSLTSVKVYGRTGTGAWSLLATLTTNLPLTTAVNSPFIVVQEAGGTGRGILFNNIDGYLN